MLPVKGEPDFLSNLREEMANGRAWLDRVVVMGFAVLSGLAVVAFTWLADGAQDLFLAQRAQHPWLALLWTPALTAAVVWFTRRWFAGAAGSGVPQVCAALDPQLPADQRGAFVSLRLSVGKMLAVSGGLLAGLSIGRQGPSVQIAAGVMRSARHLLSPRTAISERELLVAGGAAGIAAAFNTPLGGIVFAIEELSRRIEQRSSGLMLAAIVAGGLVAVSVFGNFSYFGRIHTEVVSWWALLLPGTVVALGCGLLGGLLARLMLASLTRLPERANRWRAAHPIRFAAVCGFGVAAIGLATQGLAVGGGHHHTRELLSGPAGLEQHPLLTYTGLKFIASWLSAWSGVPGGIFGPSLSIGASWGADVAHLMASPHAAALIALGMAGFLAAVTQTPITAMIIVMEMTDGHAMVLSLMGCALVASLLSRMISRPLYATLTELMVGPLTTPAPPRTADTNVPGTTAPSTTAPGTTAPDTSAPDSNPAAPEAAPVKPSSSGA